MRVALTLWVGLQGVRLYAAERARCTSTIAMPKASLLAVPISRPGASAHASIP